MGVTLPRVVAFLDAVAQDNGLLREKAFATGITAAVQAAQHRTLLDAPNGLLTLVDLYRYSSQRPPS